VTVSTPVDIDFEILCLEQAKALVESMLKQKYPTSILYDLKCLDLINNSGELINEDIEGKYNED